MITVRASKPRPRQPHQKRAPADVTRKFSCPKCGGPHSRAECDAGVTRLGMAELRRLRQLLAEELVHALLYDAPREHANAVLEHLAAVEARIARESDSPMPTLTRRAMLANIGASPRYNGGPRGG